MPRRRACPALCGVQYRRCRGYGSSPYGKGDLGILQELFAGREGEKSRYACLTALNSLSPKKTSLSDKLVERLNFVDDGEKSLSTECVKILLNRFRRVLQTTSYCLYGLEKYGPGKVKLVGQELVGMLRLDTPASELLGRKIFEISP